MNNKLLQKKFQEFRKYAKNFVSSGKSEAEDIHKLRVNSRELFSLISVKNPFFTKLKKVIKLSNKIRDIDVFYEVYLDSLPKKYIVKLDIDSMKQITNKSRAKQIEKLHLYLKSLDIPQSIEFKCKVFKSDFSWKKGHSRLSHSELHKYRIFIKKILYKEKNSFPLDEKKITTLKSIKDILGTINDNINGIYRLKAFELDIKLFKQIESFIQEQNLKLFNEFKILDYQYIKG